MARKNLLKGLIGDQTVSAAPSDRQQPAEAPTKPRPRYAKGAIGAVGQSIADLKSRAITELDPFAIDQAGVQDRLEDSVQDHDALVASIRDHGQQVPVLVRPHPDTPDRFQIVYGRRRVWALRELGLPVKAMIRDLDDQALVVAQGQENTVRKDLTFIEKANFARQMRDSGYDRKLICDALHVDKTQISRMLSVADTLGPDVIEAIGAAPGIGRNRWLSLTGKITATQSDVASLLALINLSDAPSSDERFNRLLQSLSLETARKKAARNGPDRSTVLRNAGGVALGKLVRSNGKITLTIPEQNAEGFDDWLAENFAQLHSDWLASRKDRTP